MIRHGRVRNSIRTCYLPRSASAILIAQDQNCLNRFPAKVRFRRHSLPSAAGIIAPVANAPADTSEEQAESESSRGGKVPAPTRDETRDLEKRSSYSILQPENETQSREPWQSRLATRDRGDRSRRGGESREELAAGRHEMSREDAPTRDIANPTCNQCRQSRSARRSICNQRPISKTIPARVIRPLGSRATESLRTKFR